MFIPEAKIEEIRAASDIVDVVSEYVRLKKKGTNWFGLCPFHSEKTPSFSVNPKLGIFKCFGCAKGGNVFQFVMELEKLEFPEAVRQLAERAGIELPEETERTDSSSEIETIHHALRLAARFYFNQLTQTEAGRSRGLAYFRRRGFTADSIKTFGLGYAPDAWDALLRHAGEQHVSPETLEKAGLVLPRKEGGGHYDRFRDRVMFPIFSHVGKVLGFGGRILENAPDQPKYINSPETKVYHKSEVLYGLFQGKQEIRRREEALLVEGYTDVISLHQAGVLNVVASSGTALTVQQIRAIKRYAGRILLLYDADAAGANASLRGIDLILENGLTVYLVSLPRGADPDSYVREEGAERFREYLEKHRQDFITFKVEQARRQGAFDTPEGLTEAMRAVLSSISVIPDPLGREAYLRRAREVLDLPSTTLYQAYEELVRARERGQRREPRRPAPEERPAPEPGERAAGAEAPPAESRTTPAREPLPAEKLLLRLMLERGVSLIEFIMSRMALEEFGEGPSRRMVEHLLECFDAGVVNHDEFTGGRYGEEIRDLAAEVLNDWHEVSANWVKRQQIDVPRLNEDPYESAVSAMQVLKLDRINELIDRQDRLLYRAQQEGGDHRSLLQQKQELIGLREQIRRREFLDWNTT